MTALPFGAAQSGPLPTPCMGLCQMDAAAALCRGCARTGSEIAEWPGATEREKAAIWAKLPDRRDALGLACWRLPWTKTETARFLHTSLAERAGTWQLAMAGDAASFPPAPDTRITNEPDATVARAPGIALRLRAHDKTAAFAFRPPGAADRMAVGLALPKGRVGLPVACAAQPAGRDLDAIAAEDRDATIFDLGLGQAAMRVLLRTRDPALARLLMSAEGQPAPEVLQVMRTAPDAQVALIVETGLGRIERDGIPYGSLPHGGIPDGWPLQPAFLPCAWFVPGDDAAGALGKGLR